MNQGKLISASVSDKGIRLDKFLIQHFPEYSRQYFQLVIQDGLVSVNNRIAKAGYKIKENDRVYIAFPPVKDLEVKPVNIPLKTVYEDDDLMVIDKQAGIVVHAGTGGKHIEDSLVNALLFHAGGKLSQINGVIRPGIVHRLDKDTSGLLIVAKNNKAHLNLSEQFSGRTVQKYYMALLVGHLEPLKGVIEAPIGRSSSDRKKMAVTSLQAGRNAISAYEVQEYVGDFTLVKVRILTGRTHQIRVHFASIKYPVVGDPLYGNDKINKLFKEEFGLERQFLHAAEVEFRQPSSGEDIHLKSNLPEDLELVIKKLREINGKFKR